MTRIISVANQKGGVGKTTTAINLSAALVHFNRRVLLIDMDPQGDCSRGLGIDVTLANRTIFEVLANGKDINKVIRKTSVKNLDLICAKLSLSTLDGVVSNKVDLPQNLLKNAISNLQTNYDYIIIDCPPSLGLLTINALVASNNLIITVQPEYFALEAVSQMLASVSRVQNNYNPDLGIEGVLLTMFDAKTKFSVEISQQIRGLFKENTFLSQIPRNVSIPESNIRGIPVISYRPTSSGSLAYLALAKEVMDHE